MIGSSFRYEKVGDLVASIAAGTTVLPAFQRDFDWGPTDVRSLLATILMGWPAGSLLYLAEEAAFMEVRGFEAGPEPARRPEHIVLDGQQRLTALYHALHDVGPYVYALRLSAAQAEAVEDLEDGIETFSRTAWEAGHRRARWEGPDPLIPIYALRTAETFFRWHDEMTKTAELALLDEAFLQLGEVWGERLHWLEDYPFPVLTITAPAEESDVARIFERVNRTGLQLGPFDLMVARVYREQWDLREKWEQARLDYPVLDAFLGEDGLPVLQVIALHHVRNIRRRAVLDLDRELIRREWDRALEATSRALTFLQDACAVLDPSWLPYRGMLVPLGALALEHHLERSAATLREWFFSRSFALRFDAAANTRLVEDYDELRTAVRSQTLNPLPASASLLLDATRRNAGAIWRAFLCVLAFHRARDLTGEALLFSRNDVTFTGDVVAAPIYARDTISTFADEPAIHLRVLNQVLANRSTARQLRGGGLAAVTRSLLEEVTEGDAVLSSQLLPPLDRIEELESNPVALLRERLELLGALLQRVANQRIEEEVPAITKRIRASLSAPDRERLRAEWLNRLRNEYVLSHDDIPPGIMAGTEPLPDEWLNRRIRELDLFEIFPEVAESAS